MKRRFTNVDEKISCRQCSDDGFEGKNDGEASRQASVPPMEPPRAG
jgi:hypothetical protein